MDTLRECLDEPNIIELTPSHFDMLSLKQLAELARENAANDDMCLCFSENHRDCWTSGEYHAISSYLVIEATEQNGKIVFTGRHKPNQRDSAAIHSYMSKTFDLVRLLDGDASQKYYCALVIVSTPDDTHNAVLEYGVNYHRESLVYHQDFLGKHPCFALSLLVLNSTVSKHSLLLGKTSEIPASRDDYELHPINNDKVEDVKYPTAKKYCGYVCLQDRDQNGKFNVHGVESHILRKDEMRNVAIMQINKI